ncbi:MAG: tryptophan--tRNA ligase [Patescibacteria group bacterium]|jgi:tryptophanyl-tRNA synthetase
MSEQKIIFSGVQPSGNLHLGNYLGAIKNWVNLQEKYNCIFCVVDYHAITVKQDPKELQRKIIEIAKIYLAAGINPETSIIFQQSRVSAHTELAWILNTIAKVSELERMTQFKDKARDNKSNINMGLFGYPVLMAADILLYNTDAVPVGEDQSQHVELARMLAKRFNSQFKNVFKIPEAIIKKEGARVMGLDDPKKKMSKSAASELNYIALLDEPEKARKKVIKAVTDSGSEIKFSPAKKPAVSNLLNIYSLLAETKIKELEQHYANKGYGDFKKDLAEVVVKFLKEFQHRFNNFDDKFILEMMERGRSKAEKTANKKLAEVKQAIGVS